VYLPREAFGERLGDDVLVGRAAELRVVRGSRIATATASPTPTRTATPISTSTSTSTGRGPRRVHDPASLARALAEARGSVAPDALAAAAREVNELLADGHAPDRVAACIDTVRRRAARAAAKETA
jgi:hypothetical protein